MTCCHCWLCPHGHSPALPGATLAHGIRVKVMSIHGCHVAPSSQRSHLAVMVALSGLTVSVDRTTPPASAVEGRAAATSPPPVKVHTPCSSTLARMIVILPWL